MRPEEIEESQLAQRKAEDAATDLPSVARLLALGLWHVRQQLETAISIQLSDSPECPIGKGGCNHLRKVLDECLAKAKEIGLLNDKP
jgi:hypothetical protein